MGIAGLHARIQCLDPPEAQYMQDYSIGEGVTVPITSIIASVSPLVAIRNRNSSLLSAEV